MRELLCRDAGLDCPYAVRAETDDEVMKEVVVLAGKDHPDLQLTPALDTQIRALIHDAA